MGVIFKARQPKLDRYVALKILPPDLARQRDSPSALPARPRAFARLSHPHIVAVYDFGERADSAYLIMEFVNGVNLRQAMRAGVTPEQALAWCPDLRGAAVCARPRRAASRHQAREHPARYRGILEARGLRHRQLVEDKMRRAVDDERRGARHSRPTWRPSKSNNRGRSINRADIYSLVRRAL
jgi:serine/threonine protein kinase